MRGIVTTVGACALLAATAPAASPHAGHAPPQIDIGDFSYTPAQVAIYQGDSVVFHWKGPDTNHSATGDGFDTDAGKPPAAVVHGFDDTYAVGFSKVGTFEYHCKVHPSMTGTIRVDPLPGVPAPVAPKLTKVAVTPRTFAARTTLKLTVDGPSSIRAILRRGPKTLKEIDFTAHPGANSKRLIFGSKIRAGRAVLRVVAIDPSSGKSSKTVSLKVTVKR